MRWTLFAVTAVGMACGSEKSKSADKPFEVKCTVDRSGAAKPSEGLLSEGWNMHNRDKPSLRAPKLSCDISGPRNSRAALESPPSQIRIGSEGTDHFSLAIDKLDPMQKELVITSGKQRVTVPLAITPFFGEAQSELTEQGALVVSGTVYGAKVVTVAGKQVPVLDSKFSAVIDPGAYLQERLPLLALPLEMVRSLELLLSAGDEPNKAYAAVTSPTPAFVNELRDALLNSKPIPQAAPLKMEADRPTLAVVTEPDGKRLLSPKDDIKLSEVELIAHVTLNKVVVEQCRYVSAEMKARVADLPAERVTYQFDISLNAAKDGKPVGTGKVTGKIPPECPDKLTTSATLDKKLFIGSIPSYADLMTWIRAYVPKPGKK